MQNKYMPVRIWCSLLMIPLALFSPFWVFAIFSFIYACIWTPYELLVLAVCIDAQFNNSTVSVYLYTLTVSVFLIMSVYIKPFLRFYT